mgnify:CR=1 FL=1
MKIDVEVLLKGTDKVVTEAVAYDGPEPQGWTDADVEAVLLSTLRVFEKVLRVDSGTAFEVSLRGLSWIVTAAEGGVAIAIEIPSGAVVAGPFSADVDPLTAAIDRVMAKSRQDVETVH